MREFFNPREFLFNAWVVIAVLSFRAPIAFADSEPFVAVMKMDMMILPGTSAFLTQTIHEASEQGAKIVVVVLDTPGGMLQTTQEMIQTIFSAPIPVAIYVSPSGATATSAGVFITLAGHIAAMSPSTTIGAAHPVLGDGKDIEGDMKTKVENMTIAMVKSIAERRGRNMDWAEKSVKESSSLIDKDALQSSVIDIVAENIDDLLKQAKGKEVQMESSKLVLEDYSALPKRHFEISFTNRTLNVLANPNVLALLWLGATTGISIELYNPGAVLPGVVGVICLILALLVSQTIPISQGGLLLLIVGALLIGAEFFVPSGVLGVGGVIALVLGTLYIVDVSQAPDLAVSLEAVLPVALVIGAFMLLVVTALVKSAKRKVTTGIEGLIGQRGSATDNISSQGKVFVHGEIWKATTKEGIIDKGSQVEVVGVKEGLVLEVRKVS